MFHAKKVIASKIPYLKIPCNKCEPSDTLITYMVEFYTITVLGGMTRQKSRCWA